ncbi:MAG TPA: HAMP domain-containing sensor histidine kinase [Gemmatimonadales bacterium]|nr:HAMP domain-containing sensor histidine kinase [Gemmatimonadales bacterium]
MNTLRDKLAFWYTIALSVAIFALGAGLYFDRKQSIPAELDKRLGEELTFARNYLSESQRILGSVTARGAVGGDSLPTLSGDVSAYFEGFRDYLVVAGRNDRILYASESVRSLSSGQLDSLISPLRAHPGTETGTTLRIDGIPEGMRLRVAPLTDAGPEVTAVLVATRADNVEYGPDDLLRSLLVLGPLFLVLASGLGWLLAGRALQPLDPMLDEIEAITGGTDLHRRLAVPFSQDELHRMAVSTNSMLERLETSFGSLRQFTADASHELKTPLQVLRAGIERALKHQNLPPEAIEGLDEALGQVNQMGEMVESLLTLARADEGKVELAVERTDLQALVQEVSETAHILAEQKGITMLTRITGPDLFLDVDKGRMRQMLMNLVTNAIKYTPQGGEVKFDLVGRDHDIVFEVRDTGIGISPEDLPRVFDRFWRGDVARTRTGERAGAGLGLAITKWIADSHGGRIEANSKQGRGSSFVVTIPRQRASAEPAAS